MNYDIKDYINLQITRISPSQSELTPIVYNMELTHLDSETFL